MAKDGGGGAFGWTLLGFLAGIAATLGVQILIGGAERPSHAAASSGAIRITTLDSGPIKPVKKAVHAASSAPAPLAAAAQPEAEVADDAAAAGMTSRVTPAGEPPPQVPSSNATSPANN